MIVEFTCAKCGRQFEPTAGGRCAICGKVLCALHLSRLGTPSLACEECAPERFPVRRAWRRIWRRAREQN